MTEHYYSENPQVKSNPQQITSFLRNQELKLTTDSGVFSKAEVDFGTKLMINSFAIENPQGLILDLGCGYGPVGITLAREFTGSTIHMTDINSRAIELSKLNANRNNVGNIEIYQSNLYEKITTKNFTAILSNPPIRTGKQVVHAIIQDAIQHLEDFGSLWVVIQKKQGAPSAEKKMEEVFGNVERVAKDKGYYILKSVKQSSNA